MSIYISYIKRPGDDPVIFSSAIHNVMSRYSSWLRKTHEETPHAAGHLVVETYEVQP